MGPKIDGNSPTLRTQSQWHVEAAVKVGEGGDEVASVVTVEQDQ
jgi:hypothetical protein